MRQIEIIQATITGFKSYSKPVTIDFSRHAGTRFLSGVNLTNPRLGSNGSGKSSAFDALFWCFYGTSIRDKRSSELLSSGHKAMSVEVQIAVDGNPRGLYRCFPPNRIEIDHIQATQDDFDQLLGLTKGRFKHSIIFGQGVPLFYDMSSADRGLLLDDILDLDVWLKLSELAGKESRDIEAELITLRNDKARIEGFLSALDTTPLHEKYEAWSQENNKIIDAMLHELAELEKEQKDNEQKITELEAKAADFYNEETAASNTEELEQSVRRLYAEVQGHQTKKNEIVRLLQLYQNSSECPNCYQPLSPEFVKHKIHELTCEQTVLDTLLVTTQKDAGAEMAALAEMRQRARSTAAHRAATHADLADLRATGKAIERDIRRLAGRVEEAMEKPNPYAAEIADLIERAAAAVRDLEDKNKAIDSKQVVQERVTYWKDGFKKIRLFMVRQTLQLIEVTAANVASAFGLGNWTIKLATEQETKSGTIRPGIHLSLSEGEGVTPREFSPGEEQRIRLAVALGLGAVIEQLAGVHWRFQVFDEPTAWLSGEGVEDLLTLLAYRADSEDKVVWVIDHAALVHAGFSEIWQVTKDRGGSQLERLAAE